MVVGWDVRVLLGCSVDVSGKTHIRGMARSRSRARHCSVRLRWSTCPLTLSLTHSALMLINRPLTYEWICQNNHHWQCYNSDWEKVMVWYIDNWWSTMKPCELNLLLVFTPVCLFMDVIYELTWFVTFQVKVLLRRLWRLPLANVIVFFSAYVWNKERQKIKFNEIRVEDGDIVVSVSRNNESTWCCVH